MKISLKHQRTVAFSLVEAMVGCAVAGIVMMAAYAGVASGFQTMQLTRENLRATQILVERLEAIRGGSKWSQLTNSATAPPDFVEYYTPGTNGGTGEGIEFSGRVTIGPPVFKTAPSPLPAYIGTDGKDLKMLTITLTWTNYLSGATAFYSSGSSGSATKNMIVRTRSMSTFITSHGL